MREIKFITRLVQVQYTGLKDSKNQEIYEGDIVKDFSNCSKAHPERFKIKEIKFGSFWRYESHGSCDSIQDYGYYLSPHTSWHFTCCLSPGRASMLEVIGNIYENKELLNECT